jgi:hypothetical protein
MFATYYLRKVLNYNTLIPPVGSDVINNKVSEPGMCTSQKFM